MLAKSYIEDVDENIIEDIFYDNNRLSFLFKDGESWKKHIGLIDALSIIIPEKFGVEILDLIKYEFQDPIWKYFAKSFNWRNPDSITESSLNYFRAALSKQSGFMMAYEIFMLLMTRENHPLNSNWLHNFLSSFTMTKRDGWWSPYLHTQYNNENSSVYRLIKWCFRVDPKTIEKNVAELWSIALFWYTSSSNRTIRDEATRAIVQLLQANMKVWPSILELFEKVDDYYIFERILISLYATVMLSDVDHDSGLKIYNWLDNYVQHYGIPVNVKLRDYIRLIIYSLINKGVVNGSLSVSQFDPPYSSTWPLVIPSDSEISNYNTQEYKIRLPKLYQSCFNDDFKKYVIDDLIRDFEGLNNEDAAKWVFKWVLDQGYGTKEHSRFDGYIVGKFGTGRKEETWAERIGKKYQWLAILELTARLIDNAKISRFKSESSYHDLQGTEYKDIDPTVQLRYSNIDNKIPTWWAPIYYDHDLTKDKSDPDWIETSDFPQIKENLTIKSRDDTEFYVLRLEQDWSTRYTDKNHYRLLDFWLLSFIVKKSNLSKAWKGFKDKISNESLDHPPEIGDYFFGEYPWSIQFKGYEHKHSAWEDFSNSKFSYMHPYLKLNHEGLKDEFTKEIITLFVPTFEFFNDSKLQWDGLGNYCNDEGEPIFSNPFYYETGPSSLLVTKEYLEKFLDKNGYALIWVVFGRKMVISSPSQSLNKFIPMSFKLENGKISTGRLIQP